MNTCPTVIQCNQTNPVYSYSADTPDTLQFFGSGYGPQFPPPLGWTFDNPIVFATALSPTSQAAADAAAYALSVQNTEAGWFSPNATNYEPPVFPQESSGVFVGQAGGLDTLPVL